MRQLFARALARLSCGVLAVLLLASVAALAGCAPAGIFAGNPTPTVTVDAAAVQQQLDALARQAAADFTSQVQTTYDASQRTAQVQVTVTWTDQITYTDIAKEQERDKTICFRVQQAIWNAGHLPVHQLIVTVLGPITTGYGEQYIDAHAAARLTSATAAGFTWATLTPDTAWARYDEAYLRSDYYPPVV